MGSKLWNDFNRDIKIYKIKIHIKKIKNQLIEMQKKIKILNK